jgi:hypothetical protein
MLTIRKATRLAISAAGLALLVTGIALVRRAGAP